MILFRANVLARPDSFWTPQMQGTQSKPQISLPSFFIFATSRQPLPESEDKTLLCRSDRREHNEGLRGIINIGLGDGPSGIPLESSSFWFSFESRLNVTAVIRVQQNSLFHISFLACSLRHRLLSSLSPTWMLAGVHVGVLGLFWRFCLPTRLTLTEDAHLHLGAVLHSFGFYSLIANSNRWWNDQSLGNKLYMVWEKGSKM